MSFESVEDSPEKHALRKKKNPMDSGYLVKKNNNKQTEDGKSGLYFLTGKGCISGDPSKQLNMRKLTGQDAFRGNHTNHITAWCWELAARLRSPASGGENESQSL